MSLYIDIIKGVWREEGSMYTALCMRHNTDESAGYAIFSQPHTREIASIGEKTA